MNPKENKVLSEYFKKIEKAEQSVLQSNVPEAIVYFLKNMKICDKTVNYLFQFADKKYKEIFLNSRNKFTPEEQIAICTFGTADMIKKVIGKLLTSERLSPAVEKILLGPTKRTSLYYYIFNFGRPLASENLLQFFQTTDTLFIENYFQQQKSVPIDKPAFNELKKRDLGKLFIEHFDKCLPTKEALLAVFESDMKS